MIKNLLLFYAESNRIKFKNASCEEILIPLILVC